MTAPNPVSSAAALLSAIAFALGLVLPRVAIPPGVRQVRVQVRDQAHGYGGRAQDVALPGR